MKSNFKYSYKIVAKLECITEGLATRSVARNELREVKAMGYADAKIVREEYLLVNTRQVR